MKRYFRIILSCTLLFLTGTQTMHSQNPSLAEYYLNQGEYEKASLLYQKLVAKDPANLGYFERYIQSLSLIPRMSDAEEEIQNFIKERAQLSYFGYFLSAGLLEIQGDIEGADKQINAAIDAMPRDANLVLDLGNRLIAKSRYADAIRALEFAEKNLGMQGAFEREMAEYYLIAGNYDQMINRHLTLLLKYPNSLAEIQSKWSDNFGEEEYGSAIKKIYTLLQKNQNVEHEILLGWCYTRLLRFDRALQQYIALDKRTNGDGLQVFELGKQAYESQEYAVAVSAFEYILSTKAKSSAFYIPSKFSLLTTYRKQFTKKYIVDTAQLRKISNEYASFFDDFPVDDNNIMMLRDWSELRAFDLNEVQPAIDLVEEHINQKGLNPYAVGNLKLLLGDIYLMSGDRWEATLLYSQVDKQFREGLLGEQARFKNAKLSYYLGDFEWAQSQFEVLKTATSRLISNDAIDLSVFITDNLGLDTSSHAMEDFAQAEFQRFQRNYEQALQTLSIMLISYPDHSLTDDIYFELGNLYRDRGDIEQALQQYHKIIQDHKEEIRYDNALYESALLYENYLEDEKNAMNLYEKIFVETPSSTFAVDARRRLRLLRGDDVQ